MISEMRSENDSESIYEMRLKSHSMSERRNQEKFLIFLQIAKILEIKRNSQFSRKFSENALI